VTVSPHPATTLLHVNLHFGDFVLLSILLSILYFITLVESWQSPEGSKDFGSAKADRRKTASWAFFGILFTLCAGVVAESGLVENKLELLLVPTLFLGRWAYIHYVSSEVLDFDVVLREIELLYLRAIREALVKAGSKGATIEELHDLVGKRLGAMAFQRSGKALLKSVAHLGLPAALLNGAKNSLFTKEKIQELLSQLIQANEVVQTNDRFYYKLLNAPW
jgi:hypothetical protein